MEICVHTVTVKLKNDTGYKLELITNELIEGDWSEDKKPPANIDKEGSVEWKCESKESYIGTEGIVRYKMENKDTNIYLSWDSPFYEDKDKEKCNKGKGPNGYIYRITGGDCEDNFELSFSEAYEEQVQRRNTTVCFHLKPATTKIRHPSSWMCHISNNTSLGNLSIPGTHNSCAFVGPVFAVNHTIICQDKNIVWQLNNGIRFLDLRFKVRDDDLAIYHGIFEQRKRFYEILDDCIDFLKENKNETILIRVKEEDEGNKDLISIFNKSYRYNNKYKNYLYLKSNIPLLGEVRGKIVIISQLSGIPGIPWGGINIQDDYKQTDTKKKKASIAKHIDDAIKLHKNHPDLFINFINVSPVYDTTIVYKSILEFAEELNSYLLKTIRKKHEEEKNLTMGLGIFAMDFPNILEEEDLKKQENVLKEIINLNFSDQ